MDENVPQKVRIWQPLSASSPPSPARSASSKTQEIPPLSSRFSLATSNNKKKPIEAAAEDVFPLLSMLFYSFFKSLVGKDVVVELKNDLSICGTLHSVDQYLNIKLTEVSVTDPDRHPHMLSVKNCFIRGSVVR